MQRCSAERGFASNNDSNGAIVSHVLAATLNMRVCSSSDEGRRHQSRGCYLFAVPVDGEVGVRYRSLLMSEDKRDHSILIINLPTLPMLLAREWHIRACTVTANHASTHFDRTSIRRSIQLPPKRTDKILCVFLCNCALHCEAAPKSCICFVRFSTKCSFL